MQKKNKLLYRAAALLLALLLLSLSACTASHGGGEDTTGDAPPISSGKDPSASSTVPGSESTGGESSGGSTAADTTAPALMLDIPRGKLDAAQVIVYDTAERRAIYEYNGVIDGKVYPASTTKLFTALTALDYLSPEDVITAGEELSLVASDSSIAYVRRGHRLTVSMLIEGMLLPSGGDAAYVLAAAAGRRVLGGSASAKQEVAAFVAEMNRKLAALGLSGTHFANPDGYHDPDHYTTLSDIARIGALALENATIMKYATLAQDRVIYASGESNNWQNTNKLIHSDSPLYRADAVGLKTGSTDEAGYCLLTAKRGSDGRYYVVGIFGASTGDARFKDAAKVFDLLDAFGG